MTTLLWEQDIREESEQRGEKLANEKWQGVLAKKDAVLAENEKLREQLATLQAKLKN
jgi:hypothetical protein